MNGNRVILAAHRGDRKNFPENTMPAFYSALRHGVDMIETDIHMTSDGFLVIMHDRSALRTTGTDAFIDQMTLEQVRELDAGSMFSPAFAGTKVPTVAEFMQWVKDTNLLVNWELKDYVQDVGRERAFACADKLLEAIEQAGMSDRSMVNSFDNEVLGHIYRKAGKRYPIHGQGIGPCARHQVLSDISDEEMFDWVCMYANVSGGSPLDYPENFTYCLDRGILPCVCIKDTEENYRRALALGCKMFTSNDIEAAQVYLQQMNVR